MHVTVVPPLFREMERHGVFGGLFSFVCVLGIFCSNFGFINLDWMVDVSVIFGILLF